MSPLSNSNKVLYFLVLALSLFASAALAAQKTGPVVFGLYLGMPYEEAAQILGKEGYEIKLDPDYKELRAFNPSMPYTRDLSKNGKLVGSLETQELEGDLEGFGLALRLFGIKDYDQLNFAKQFLDHYKIPYSPDMFSIESRNQLLLTNRQDGYEIRFPGTIHEYVTIKRIQKNSEIQFK